MNTRYELTYDVPPEMLRRAMTSWARPQRSLGQKALRFGMLIVGGGIIGAVLTVSGVIDALSDQLMLGMLIGFYIGLAFWLIMHTRDLRRLARMTATQIAKQGPTHAVYRADGVETATAIGSARSSWAAYDQVIAMRDATALRSGGVIYPIPHAALPHGVDPATFHADLTRWQEAGQ